MNSRHSSRWTLILLPLIMLFLSLGCGQENSAEDGPGAYPYKIVVTTGMIRDVVAKVAGDKAEVSAMMGADVDPHLYKPTMKDVQELQSAKVIFYNGLHLEGKLDDVLGKVEKKSKVVALGEALDQSEIIYPEDAAGEADPHAWMNVALWSKVTDIVARTLSEFDPENAEYYQANAKAYQTELAALQAYVKEAVATIPEDQRVLITAHDAFNYYAEAYGVEVRGVQGLSTLSEAGTKDVEDLVTFIVDRKIAAVFFESSVSDKNINILFELATYRGHPLKKGGMLFSDAMGMEGTYEGTYIGMIDHNTTTLVRALGGEAPEKGFQGKLTPGSHEH